jgi:hypothetical protein
MQNSLNFFSLVSHLENGSLANAPIIAPITAPVTDPAITPGGPAIRNPTPAPAPAPPMPPAGAIIFLLA